MASEEKFTNSAIINMFRHNDRSTVESSNVDIDPERTKLNYSFEMNHHGLSDFKYYKELIGSKYIYGRRTEREKDAITACGWVITAPKEIIGDKAKEDAFFEGVFNFVSERYGADNVINNAVHYDEAGAPHIHIIFVPVTKIDHEKVQYRTYKTKIAERTESGRYEFIHNFKLDENGEKIFQNNYARMTDYYDEKISANDVLNTAELRHFHDDLQAYLDKHNIEGSVKTGKTGGLNFTVKVLKEFTAKTGLTIDQVKEIQGDKTLLERFVEQHTKINALEAVIDSLKEEITANMVNDKAELKNELKAKEEEIKHLKDKINELEASLAEKRHEIETMKEDKVVHTDEDRHWGDNSASWGDKASSGWGSIHISEEKLM